MDHFELEELSNHNVSFNSVTNITFSVFLGGQLFRKSSLSAPLYVDRCPSSRRRTTASPTKGTTAEYKYEAGVRVSGGCFVELRCTHVDINEKVTCMVWGNPILSFLDGETLQCWFYCTIAGKVSCGLELNGGLGLT